MSKNPPFVLYKCPYNIYDIIKFRDRDRYNIMTIDPAAKKNAVFTIERHYKNGLVRTLVSDKKAFNVRNYETVKKHLNNYNYNDVKIVIIEKQLSQNIPASNFAKHLLLYFSIHVECILIEVSPKLKSEMFSQLNGLKGKKLKDETVKVALKLSRKEKDKMAYQKMKEDEKPDDRADTKVQRAGIFRWLKDKNNQRLLETYIRVNFE